MAIVEDDPEIRRNLALIINESEGFVCEQMYADCPAAFKGIAGKSPDIILMDIGLPGMSGIEGTRRIKELLPSVDIIIITVNEDVESIFQSLSAGATGYLTKDASAETILRSIREVFEGGSPMSASIARKVVNSFQVTTDVELTHREREILQHLCKGENYKAIASELFVSGHTVRSHIKNIYRKLHAHSRAEAVSVAFKHKLV